MRRIKLPPTLVEIVKKEVEDRVIQTKTFLETIKEKSPILRGINDVWQIILAKLREWTMEETFLSILAFFLLVATCLFFSWITASGTIRCYYTYTYTSDKVTYYQIKGDINWRDDKSVFETKELPIMYQMYRDVYTPHCENYRKE